MTLFKKKRSKEVSGISTTEHTEYITERDRSPVDTAKVEAMVWLLSKVANEDLDAVWIALLTELDKLGYKLAEEPGALLEGLKRLF